MIKIYSKIKLSLSLEKKIAKELNMEVSEINFLIDESIYSGIRVENNSEVIDLTINARIEKIFESWN